MTRIIFVEGVSGVGKSTITKKLRDKLRAQGLSADCYLEGDALCPIDFYSTAHFTQAEYADLTANYSDLSEEIRVHTIFAEGACLIRYYNQKTPLFEEPLLTVLRDHEFSWNPSRPLPLAEFTRVYKSVWEQFAQNLSNDLDYLIFDGALFHHQINDLLRNYGASDEQITGHISTLLAAVDTLKSQVIYISSVNVSERLRSARKSRGEAPLSDKQIAFWERRKQIDLAVMRQLAIPCDVYDITNGGWDSAVDLIISRLAETPDERRARIYPVVLSEYNPAWPEWFAKEKANLERLIDGGLIVKISHYGSTSVPGLTAKPTIDILLEISETADIAKLISALSPPDYICLDKEKLTISTPPPHLMFLKGYLPNGFARKVYHIHVVYPGEHEALRFRDYLIAHPEAAAEYAALKRGLLGDFGHNRDGYTAAKTEFVSKITAKAREQK